MRHTLIAFVLLSCAGILDAQTTALGTSTLWVQGPVSQSCPTEFSARRMAAPALIVTKGAAARQPGLGVQLAFSGDGTARIIAADITVHGASAGARIMPAGTAIGSMRTETFQLRTGDLTDRLVEPRVWLNKLVAVSWIDLTEVRYADGTVWHTSSESRCRAIPSSFLLVDAAP